MWSLAGMVLLAYLLGSLSGSLLLGKLRQVDIRTLGSGNAGGTNAFRTQGFWFALGVVVVDVGKGVVAVAWLPALVASPGATAREVAMLACGFAAIVGHCYPLYHGFRGGKGAATALGALLVVQPCLLLPMVGTWLVALALSGYVGLATVLAGFSLLPGALWLDASPGLWIFCVASAAFMAFTHRSNLQRMRAGTEHRFERARLTRWFRRAR
ncbi:MAG: glycerol-3-phosphate 1-O-acyltransferase PlsY [Xanthomonadales bacterium]|nr:glycerol-3-phosphate 1-O-acyltransferase PlsY [Xanthomonadales bacterium]NIN58585.1 glycerol-3-phosphate 1-O-acyltransferase PlsY [Xanthomonadales bacterium]NIN73874.1 glycerol-3-phosphate 1-O-acyltransferase PlsY [Xanthomonadales bacterium]NIO12343.1 glycerol-3-phosphate 1-O-acyltransferase PlsY [Xanthomonadales bacterium]NIP10978.1 glycerol-3-phosphate 1-O-acyltransferase PlsY [Xanthomonadales bacterium]